MQASVDAEREAEAQRRAALTHAVEALSACDAEDREELILTILARMWGQGPVLSLLDEEVEADALCWAAGASPVVLSAYLGAILSALDEANFGKQQRGHLARKILNMLSASPAQKRTSPAPPPWRWAKGAMKPRTRPAKEPQV